VGEQSTRMIAPLLSLAFSPSISLRHMGQVWS
jgi:hypothetical protein